MHDPWTCVWEFPTYKTCEAFRRRTKIRVLTLMEIWHHDPSDYDSETCGNDFRRLSHWRHWHLRVPPLMRLRRRLIDRCAYCGGLDTKANRLDHSFGHPDRPHWWWGTVGVFHGECSKREAWARVSRHDNAEREGYQKGYVDGHRAASEVSHA